MAVAAGVVAELEQGAADRRAGQAAPDPDELGLAGRRLQPTGDQVDLVGQVARRRPVEQLRFRRPGQQQLQARVGTGHPGPGWQLLPADIRFQVADDGIGIARSHQLRIFERFYKVDRSRARGNSADAVAEEATGGSAGLGLAIVRHIAEAHGGSVGLESEEGAGSTFWIDVPLSR